MPNRILKDTINESAGLSECSHFAVDLYKRLITYADDYGRFNADTMIMRARLYPREWETVNEEDIQEGLEELCGVGKIAFYTPFVFNQFGKKGVYGVFPNWSEHQRVRDTKSKCPDPDDTTVNDWYLRRFIPLAMKADVVERDGFKCQICGKHLTTCTEAKRFVKLGTGLFHIDHVVPVLQGGRATMENLRLTCPECNLKRKKTFTFADLLAEYEFSRQVAADCGNSRPNPIQSNPIQSESKSKSKHARARVDTPDLSMFTGNLLEKMHQWFLYKQERSEHYTPTGWSSLVKQVQHKADEYGERAVCELIDTCMAAGWKGIIFDRLKEAKKTNKPSNDSFDIDEIERLCVVKL